MAQQILVLGAGRSSWFLIDYLAKYAIEHDWIVRVADRDQASLESKTKGYDRVEPILVESSELRDLKPLIKRADLVISLLPAFMQEVVASFCLDQRKSFLTASYLPHNIKEMHKMVRDRDLLFIFEVGLDPGIDHISAMDMIDRVRNKGGTIKAFRSFTGALVAPESDNNPWHYKFTWNPRNVVRAGQSGTAKYYENKHYAYIPYHQLFRRIWSIKLKNHGEFEGFANRDSLIYRYAYQLEEVPTVLRGTLRSPGFCAGWQVLIDLGMLVSDFNMPGLKGLSYRDFTASFVADTPGTSLEEKIAQVAHIPVDGPEMELLRSIGLLSEEPISIEDACPADVIQDLLERKWSLDEEDKDMVVMQHQVEYELDGKTSRLVSEMMLKGDSYQRTAIARTVGIPLGITAKLMLTKQINIKGVHIPTQEEIYAPVLEELNALGISFEEYEEDV